MKHYLTYLFLILNYLPVLAQNSFEVNFYVSKNIKPDSLSFILDDGIDAFKNVEAINNGDVLTIKGKYYGKYATIKVNYPNKAEKVHYYQCLWVGDKTASVYLDNAPEDKFYSLSFKNLRNCKSVAEEGEKSLDTFSNKERDAYDKFYLQNYKISRQNDSIANQLTQLHKTLIKKKIQYLQGEVPNNYYSLWLFRNDIANSPAFSNDSLVYFFKTFFSDSLQSTFEGKQILDTINSKLIVKNYEAPNFIATDYKKNTFSLKELNTQGKCVLLIFWASWCKPCIEEIPTLKKLRTKFNNLPIEFISVSKDENEQAYLQAVEKYEIKWISILGNDKILAMYNCSTIPKIIFIDSKGIIRYVKIGNDGDIYSQLDKIFLKYTSPK